MSIHLLGCGAVETLTHPEALALLTKWKADRRVLQCMLVDTANTTQSSCLGHIVELTKTSMRIEAGAWGRHGEYFWCVLDLENASFMLTDSEDMPTGRPNSKADAGCE